MKILFVTEHYFPHRDANGNCVWHLVQEMQRQGHELTVLSKAVGKEQTLHQYDGQTHLVWYRYDADMKAEQILQLLRKSPAAAIKAFLAAAAGRLFLTKKRSNPPDEWQTYVIKKALYKVLQTEKIDLVIATVFTVENAYACMKLTRKKQMSCPYYVYQVDSYVDNQTLDPKLRAKRLQYIQKIYQYATSVFLHPLQRSEAEIMQRDGVCSKIHFVEFPNLMPLYSCEQDCSDVLPYGIPNAINCVYIGSLYTDIRNPSFMIELFAALSDKNVHLHILGHYQSDLLLQYAGVNDNVHFYNAVDAAMYCNIIYRADVLVNIGNTTCNQLPSKLFDYFSTGRPIVHMAKHMHCTSTPYVHQYPNAITLVENSQSKDTQIKMLGTFVLQNYQKPRIPFVEIETIYHTATPAYVSALMLRQCSEEYAIQRKVNTDT